MVTVTITMDVQPAKRNELLIAIQELTEAKRSEQGFVDARVCMDNGNESQLTLIEEWETPEDVEVYLQSEYFRILLGGIKILTSSAYLEHIAASGKKECQQIHNKSAAKQMVRNTV